MKNTFSKERLIAIGKEIELYGTCKIKLEDMIETKKYAKEVFRHDDFGWSQESFVANLVRAEALRMILSGDFE